MRDLAGSIFFNRKIYVEGVCLKLIGREVRGEVKKNILHLSIWKSVTDEGRRQKKHLWYLQRLV